MLKKIINRFKEREDQINDWLNSKCKLLGQEPLYVSTDLRNAGFKIVPVDTNIFPGGWNNLCKNYFKKAADCFKSYFDEHFPGTKCLLILPEDHTRNLYYFSNLKALQDILIQAGFDTKIGTLNPDLGEVTTFSTKENQEIIFYKIHREEDNIFVDNKRVCQIIVNNDYSSGIPEILKGITQNLLPSPEIGWHFRKKSDHQKFYFELIAEFAELIEMDKWFFASHFSVCSEVDFDNVESREKVALKVDDLINIIKNDYAQFGVNSTPTVFIKNNAGTYGMGIIKVKSGDEVRNLNQKMRKQMRTGKYSSKITEVILQEGVVTTERMRGMVAEPVLYLVGNKMAGGFYRLNREKGDLDNLNSKGMEFSKSCLYEDADYENRYGIEMKSKDFIFVYKVISEITSLAAGMEIKAIQK